MVLDQQNSYNGTRLPASIVQCVRLGSYHSPLQNEPLLCEGRCDTELSTTNFSQLRRHPLVILGVCGPGLPPSSKLIGFTVRGPISFLLPSFLAFSLSPWMAEKPPSLAAPSTRDRRWTSDGEVQPLQLLPSQDRGHNTDPRHSDLIAWPPSVGWSFLWSSSLWRGLCFAMADIRSELRAARRRVVHPEVVAHRLRRVIGTLLFHVLCVCRKLFLKLVSKDTGWMTQSSWSLPVLVSFIPRGRITFRDRVAAFASCDLEALGTAVCDGKLGKATRALGALSLGVTANGMRFIAHVDAVVWHHLFNLVVKCCGPLSRCNDIGLRQSNTTQVRFLEVNRI